MYLRDPYGREESEMKNQQLIHKAGARTNLDEYDKVY